MDILSCPVCGLPLLTLGRCLRCEKGHSFDISKEGYVNLLPSGKGQHGDNTLMLSARRRFLDSGYYENLKDTLCAMLCEVTEDGAVLLDEGCGEGYYTEGMSDIIRAKGGEVYAFDISREAVKLAARRVKDGRFFVGSAYRVPVLSESADAVSLLFSPFCREEILRILKPNGLFLMAVPGKMHLYGLKQALYETPYPNALSDTAIKGLSLLSHRHIASTVTVEGKENIGALFSMTPYYYKTSKIGHERLASLESLTTPMEFELLLYRKC